MDNNSTCETGVSCLTCKRNDGSGHCRFICEGTSRITYIPPKKEIGDQGLRETNLPNLGYVTKPELASKKM